MAPTMQGPHTSIKMPQLQQHRGSEQGKRPETASGSSMYSQGNEKLIKNCLPKTVHDHPHPSLIPPTNSYYFLF